jgi:hypothetical protein
MTNFDLWQKWLATLPKDVRQIARRYPLGTKFRIHGKLVYVISYEEGGGLSIAATNPADDYEKAVAERQPICECCAGNLDTLRTWDDI